MSDPRTYLDYNATAPLRPESREALLAALDLIGNASSVHAEGRAARKLVEAARAEIAALVGASPDEVVFTSSATEANNWVMRAGWDAIALSATEHESVLAPARAFNTNLYEIPCGITGVAAAEAMGARIAAFLRAGRRSLLSLHLANAETGVIQPVPEAVVLARENGAIVHSDAVQAVGRIRVSFSKLALDLMSVSAHKIGGPKGVGALVVRNGVELPPMLLGGGQEGRRRAGTENVAAIAGFGAAAKAARRDLAEMDRVAALRDRLEAAVDDMLPIVVMGRGSDRLPNTSCFALPHQQAATLLIKLDLAGIAVSAGSACSSGKIGGSHVLAAMGIDASHANAAIRVSLGPGSTEADVDRFLAAWTAIHRDAIARRRANLRASQAEWSAPIRNTAGE